MRTGSLRPDRKGVNARTGQGRNTSSELTLLANHCADAGAEPQSATVNVIRPAIFLIMRLIIPDITHQRLVELDNSLAVTAHSPMVTAHLDEQTGMTLTASTTPFRLGIILAASASLFALSGCRLPKGSGVGVPYPATNAKISLPFQEMVSLMGEWAETQNELQSKQGGKKRQSKNKRPFPGWGPVQFRPEGSLASLHLTREWTYASKSLYERNVDVAVIAVRPGSPFCDMEVTVFTRNALAGNIGAGNRDKSKENKLISRVTNLLGNERVKDDKKNDDPKNEEEKN